MANFYNENIKDIIEGLNTSTEIGLTAEEAARRIAQYG